MDSLSFLIKAKLEKLPESERKIADYILREQRKVVYMNLIELAENSKSSQSAVIRFCKHLGVPGFHDLKIMLARDVFGGVEIEDVQPLLVDGSNGAQGIISNVVASLLQAIKDMPASVNAASLERAAEIIESAEFVQVFGVGTSGIVALDLYHKLERIGIRCAFVSDCHLQITAACGLRKSDLGIFVSYSGETPEMVRAASEAKSNGAGIIALTKRGRNSIANLSDLTLHVPTSESIMRQGASSSRIAQLVVVDMIFSLLVSRRPHPSVEMLERTLRATRRGKLT
jgi:RpiR family transcriptional regulator, carbohydrate utilization regulator